MQTKYGVRYMLVTNATEHIDQAIRFTNHSYETTHTGLDDIDPMARL